MAMDSAKKTGLVVALGMPSPHRLKSVGDEGESDAEDMAEDEGAGSGGAMALGEMWAALKSGDKTAAFDAFCDAMSIAKGKAGEAKAEGESYGEE